MKGKSKDQFRIRPRLESLEGRDVPTALIGLVAGGTTLVAFDSAAPETLIGPPLLVTGLQLGETLVGIDSRPSNGQLYGIGSTNRIYTLNAATGAATTAFGPFTPALSGTSYGVDFNPLVDRIRVVSNGGQSLRVNQIAGTATADPTLFYVADDDTNRGYFGTVDPADPTSLAAVPANVSAVAAGYTLTFDATLGQNVTTLYGIDDAQDLLFRIGGPNSEAPNPNLSRVFAVGQLTTGLASAVDFGPNVGFDIEASTDEAFASNESILYFLNITDGSLDVLGTIGGNTTPGGFVLTGLTIRLPGPGDPVTPGRVSLPADSFTFPPNRSTLAIQVARTDGSSGAVTVDYATADGSAVAGVDYLPTSGTLSFAAGETTRTIFLNVPGGTPPVGPAKTFTLALSNPTGGLTLGGVASATVNIPEVRANTPPGNTGGNTGGNSGGNLGGNAGTTTPPVAVPAMPTTPPVVTVIQPTRYFAIGANANGIVSVYNSNGGALAFSFRAFESSFTGGIRVASGDVNGDGFDDIIVGAGPGGGPRVQVFDGRTLSDSNQISIASFFAYAVGFTGGVDVAAGDVNGDGFADVITGAGPGGGPHVKVFSGRSFSTEGPVEIASFFAYATNFVGGVTVGGGSINGDSFADVITGAGPGGGPHVKVFDGRSLILGTPSELASFFAFDPRFTSGVNVGSGDINGDSRTDVLVGAKAGGGPHVKVYDGRSFAVGAQSELASYFAFDPAFMGGVAATARDLNRDGFDDVIAGAGPGGGPHIIEFDGRSLIGGQRRELASFFAFDPAFNGGVFVG